MSEEKKPRATTAAILLAAFAAITAVGDAARSYFERQDDVARAEKAEADRVAVDQSIQGEVGGALAEVYEILEEQDQILEEQDRAIWELEHELDLVMRTVPSTGEIVEDPEPDELPTVAHYEEPPPRKRKKRASAKPPLDFVEPEPAYDIVEQMQQRLAPPKRNK